MAASPPNRGRELLAVDVTFMVSALVANALRCFVRIKMVKAFGLDDWLMVLATLFFMAYAISSIAGVHYGTGRHHSDLPLEGIEKATHCWWFCYLFYCCSMICSKTSIGFFLLRIAIKKLHTWIIYTAMFISVVAGTTFFFVTLFQCHPISYFWNKTQPGSCINIDVIVGLGYLYSVFSIISDFTFALLPAFLVIKLQLKRKTKIALIPLLTMGCIASSAVVARVPYLPKFRDPDFLWATLDIAIWSTVEQGLAITAGSLATLRPLFSLILFKLGLTNKPRPSNYGGNTPFGGSQMLSGRRPTSRNELALYKVSATSNTGDEESQHPVEEKELPKIPTWYQTSFGRVKSMSFGKKKESYDDGSEKSLRLKGDKNETAAVGDEAGMHIMVSRNFYVSDSVRKSCAERPPS